VSTNPASGAAATPAAAPAPAAPAVEVILPGATAGATGDRLAGASGRRGGSLASGAAGGGAFSSPALSANAVEARPARGSEAEQAWAGGEVIRNSARRVAAADLIA
jgi:hypothetical protein